jgi:hypothetical protein
MRDEVWPIKDGTYDTVLCHDVLHLFRGETLFRVVWNIWAVLEDGGHLIGRVPFGVTGNPLHLSYWNETTPVLLTRAPYFTDGMTTTGCDQKMPLRDWDVVFVEIGKSMRFIMKKIG